MTAAIAAAVVTAGQASDHARRIAFADLPVAIQRQLAAGGLSGDAFDAYLSAVTADTERRVAEGEREHLVYYALQSTRFTDRAPIEPAVSARHFIDRLPPADRSRLLEDPGFVPGVGWPAAERQRVADLLKARGVNDPRVRYFQRLSGDGKTVPVDALYTDYVRVARFLYLKEAAPNASPADVERIARLYQTRPHSSDTQAESSFGVYLGLGVIRGLESSARPAPDVHSRALIVGPGMEIAPRTDLIDAVPPQSYQPFAVADALLALGLTGEGELHVHSVDVNPRVVSLLESLGHERVTIHWFSAIANTPDRPFSDDYAAYARSLGLAIGSTIHAPPAIASLPRHLRSIAVRPSVARAMTAGRLNIVTDRLIGPSGFDLVVATNVLTYFDDRQLTLALSNIAAMLRPGGYFIHNESRRGLAETASSLDLPIVHMRTAVIGGPINRPLYDTVWLHQKAR